MNTTLIEALYKEAFILSSPLNINQSLERDRVDKIYNSLKSFFGENYFTTKIGLIRQSLRLVGFSFHCHTWKYR